MNEWKGDVSRETSAAERRRTDVPTTIVKLCACGCGRPRDQDGQRMRRGCANRYMRKWRRGRRLSAADYATVVEALKAAAKFWRGGLVVDSHGAEHRPGACAACDALRDKARGASELAERLGAAVIRR